MAPNVTVEVVERVATVTLDRPPVNALSVDVMRELAKAFRDFGVRRDVGAVVLRASGDKVFCAGADINDSERRYSGAVDGNEVAADDLVDPGQVARECFAAVYDCAVPVIAAVHGVTLGAGLAMVACADIILAAEEATFGLPEIKVGVLGGGRFLQRLVGASKLRTMFFTGRREPASELYRLGAIEQVLPRGELDTAAHDLAADIARNSPIAVRLGKQSLNRIEDLGLFAGYQVEQDYTARVSRFADSAEARNAWREKREPKWSWS